MIRSSFLCFLALIFSITILNAQDTVYQAINKQTCACITANASKGFGLDEYRKCINQAFNLNIKAVQSEMKRIYPDTLNNYKKGYEYGQAVTSRLDTDLVYTCDAYFRIADTLRAASYRVNNTDSLRQLLVELNSPGVPTDVIFYQRRALVNFLLGLIDDANRDALEVFKENPNNIAALLIHANYLEKNKEYHDAAFLFYRLDQLTGQHAYLVSAAINNRKSRMKN